MAQQLYLALTLAIVVCTPSDLPVRGGNQQVEGGTITVPDGVRVIEHAPVPAEERLGSLELRRDMTIRERGEDANYRLYDADYAVMDDRGTIFVQDSGNKRVQVFDSDGDYVMTLGREGQGPGEFTEVTNLALIKDRIIVGDDRSRRFTVFSTNGELLATFDGNKLPGGVSYMVGRDDGILVAQLRERQGSASLREGVDPRLRAFNVGVLSTEFLEFRDLLRFPPYYEPMAQRRAGASFSMIRVDVPHPGRPMIAGSAAGDLIYACALADYQIVALNPHGRMEWVLRVPWQRDAIRQSEVEVAVREIQQNAQWADFRRSDYEWPTARPAIERIAVDGDNNLYVFPYDRSVDEGAKRRMVDVYAPDGDRLFSGWVDDVRWFYARGEHVLAREVDDITGEERIVRYRLHIPLEAE